MKTQDLADWIERHGASHFNLPYGLNRNEQIAVVSMIVDALRCCPVAQTPVYPEKESADLVDYFNPPRVKVAAYLLASYEDDTVAPPAKSLLDWGTLLVKGGMTAEHSGDCTNESHSCSRCIADLALAHADVILGLAQSEKVPVAWRYRYENSNDKFTVWYLSKQKPARCDPDMQVEALYAVTSTHYQPEEVTGAEMDAIEAAAIAGTPLSSTESK